MTLGDLITLARGISWDIATPPCTSDAEWARFATQGQNEAARRARLFIDSTTTAICSIPVDGTHATYTLDPRVLFIRRAKLASRSLPLTPVSYKDLDRGNPDWQSDRDEPRHFVPDLDNQLFRPWPSPIASGTVTLTVIRLPLVDLVNLADVPELAPHLFDQLLNWMLYRHWSKQDVDVNDPKKAENALAQFEAEFGPKSSAIDEEWIRTQYGFGEDEGIF